MLSVRRATVFAVINHGITLPFFYPRPPRGGRRHHPRLRSGGQKISIHALREEGDDLAEQRGQAHFVFLSTPSARRATRSLYNEREAQIFLSTPSARRATSSAPSSLSPRSYFYPRPPRGGRLSRRSSRFLRKKISIHALREEGDPRSRAARRHTSHFYPRPPRGGRQGLRRTAAGQPPISIHALREEGDGIDDLF